MAATTSSRLLNLLSMLQARRDWPGDELETRLEVSRRTVRRDIERLRELGYPIQSVSGPAGGYRLEAGTAMPPLLLDDEEAIAIAVGLRTAAGASVAGIEETSVRALVKLEQVLPKHLRRRVQALGTVASPSPGGPLVDPQVLSVVASACRDRERLRFAYTGRDGAESRRIVEPRSLVNFGRRWYLLAWDCERTDWRTFRLDRVERPAAAGGRCAERDLPGEVGDADYVAANLSAGRQRYEARVTVRCAADELEGQPWLFGSVDAIDEETCEYRTSDDNLDWLAMRIAMLGHEFELHGPSELIERLGEMRDRITRAVG
ncbi:MAG: YafY family protein [Solirubrobacterales bacterium]